LLRVARWSFVAVVAAVFVHVAVDNASQLRHVSLHVHPWWFLVGAPCTLLGGLCLPMGWRAILSAYRTRLTPLQSVRIWCLAQTSRYLPTGLVAVASRAVLASQQGVSSALAGGSVILEVAVVIGWGSLAAGLLLPSSILAAPLRAVLALAAASGLISFPFVLHAGGRRVPRLASYGLADPDVTRMWIAEGIYGINSLAKSFGSVFVGFALLHARAGDVPLLFGAVNGAAVIGMIGITPAGIGVREGVLAAMLEHRFGLGNATAFAVSLRVWDIAFEVTWLAIVGATARRTRAMPRPG
jgi:uncharacterized membrane protein YbhN (UPF0104 family)